LNPWKAIAKKEIWIKTSWIRKNRRLFFIIVYGILLFWAGYLGPILLDSFIPEIIKNYSGSFETLLTTLISSIFASLFLMQVMYPLFILFRKEKIGKSEITLASPVKAGDIFLGEFLGQIPFYTLFILGIGPFLTSLFLQINSSLTIYHHLTIYIIFLALLISGSLIGKLIANSIEYKITMSKKSRSFINSMLVIISVSVIAIFSLFQFFLGLLRTNQDLRALFLFYPSFWYSDMIIIVVNPILSESFFTYIWLEFILIFLLPPVLFYISYKKSRLVSNFDIRHDIFSARNRRNAIYTKITKKVIVKKHGGLIVIQYKNFIRKSENKIKLIYMMGLVLFFGILVMIFLKNQSIVFEQIFFSLPISIQVTFHMETIMIIVSWMGGLICGILLGISTFFETKELLEIYKKSPYGISGYVTSFMYMVFYLLILMSLFISIFFAIAFQINLLVTILVFFTFILNTIIILSQSIGIQFLRPLFLERRKNLVFNNYLTLFLQIISFLLTLYVFIPFTNEFFDPSISIMLILFINIGMSGCLAYIILSLGIWRLQKFD
jgi:hypothetical protein